MNKNGEFKNINEFLKIKFPSTYQNKKSDDDSLETFMKKNSENFKLRINEIIKNQMTHNT